MGNERVLAFFEALSITSQPGMSREAIDAFRQAYRCELFELFDMLRGVGLIGGDSDVYADDPDTCDLCSDDLGESRWFVDGATRSGEWANMCPTCFVKQGQSLGWGHGQLYSRTNDDRWRLVVGGDPAS